MKLRLLTLLILAGVALAASSLIATTAGAATNRLTITQTCSPTIPGTIRVEFVWDGNSPAALQQWLDLSLFDNGWLPGTFLGAGPFPASTNSLTWDGIIPGAAHFVRVNQQLPAGNWDPSPTFTFTTASCPGGTIILTPPAEPGGSIDIIVTSGTDTPSPVAGTDISVEAGP